MLERFESWTVTSFNRVSGYMYLSNTYTKITALQLALSLHQKHNEDGYTYIKASLF